MGWKEALLRAGLSASASFIAEGDWSGFSGERAMSALLTQEPNLDAVFAGNDQMALGALGLLHQKGYRVPEDVAIVGFDNIPESAHFWPPLTTVYQQLIEVGRLAVRKLHNLIEAKRKNESHAEPLIHLLIPELVVRASSSLVDASPASVAGPPYSRIK